MSAASIHLIYPLFAMFVLSAVVLAKMFITRIKAVKAGQMKLGYFKTYSEGVVPEEVLKASRHFSNLFEAPVLFYVVCLLGIIMPIDGQAFLIMAWLYVALRAVHAYIHIGNNKLMYRMRVYGLGWLVLVAMWVLVITKALTWNLIAS